MTCDCGREFHVVRGDRVVVECDCECNRGFDLLTATSKKTTNPQYFDNFAFDDEDSDMKKRESSLTPQPANLRSKRPFYLSPPWLLAALCFAGVVQGMIFTNVVITTLEKRFGLQSTQSGFIAGSYDLGSLVAVIPVTFYGGRPGVNKARFIAIGLLMMGLGSFVFALPHFIIES